MNSVHRHVAVKLQGLRADIHLSGIFVRDYLLDNSHLTGPSYREGLITLRDATRKTLEELHGTASTADRERIERLQANLDDYWETFTPLFGWTPNQKLYLSAPFLRRTVLPRRDAVLQLTRDIEALNNENMVRQRAVVGMRELELKNLFVRMLWITLGLGVLITLGAGIRFHIVEARADEQYRRLEEAEGEMRRLTQLLVKAQEEERKNLSRELHDQVGQMLTALRMEVGHAERSRLNDGAFTAHTAECKGLIDTIVGTVRDLSMGLRPSMLDDIGLGPALQWLARDYSRRYNCPVNVNMDGMVLRWNRTTIVASHLARHATNIGEVKGCTFDRVLIYPTQPMLKYLKTANPEDAGDRQRFYVATTRARYSVAFVIKKQLATTLAAIWKPQNTNATPTPSSPPE